MINVKTLFRLAFFLGIGTGVAQAQSSNFIVKEKTGIKRSYTTTNVRKLTFSVGNLVVTPKSGTTDSYALNALQQLRFERTVTASKEEATLGKYFTLYPNPVVDVLHLHLLNTTTQVQIVDMQGKPWLNKTVEGNEATLNVAQLPSGLYDCILKDGNTTQTTKLIKQ